MKNIAASIFFLAFIFIAISVPADEISQLSELVQKVREKLIVLLATTDKKKQVVYVDEIRQLSKDIDTTLEAIKDEERASVELKQKLLEFEAIWIAFRTTRDQEIIPAILSGDQGKIEEAKRIAITTQAERFQKMQILLR